MLAPGKVALALPYQGGQTGAHAIAGAQGHDGQDRRVTEAAGTTFSHALHCIERPNPIPSKVKAASAPADAVFSAPVDAGNPPYLDLSAIPRTSAPLLDARPQVFLKTSRLLI